MIQINWKRLAMIVLVIALLLYLTKSFWMSLGILMLIMLIDRLLADYDAKRRNNGKNK